MSCSESGMCSHFKHFSFFLSVLQFFLIYRNSKLFSGVCVCVCRFDRAFCKHVVSIKKQAYNRSKHHFRHEINLEYHLFSINFFYQLFSYFFVENMNILITGTNKGIGLELAKQLASKGNNIYATCRNPSIELQNTNATIIPNISLESDDVISQLQESNVLPEKLDGVICNAGIMIPENLRALNSTDTILKQFQINTLGPIRVFKGIENRLDKGSKYAIISAILGSIQKNTLAQGDQSTRGGYYGYRISKAGMNMGMSSLSVDLRRKKIAVAMIHPGFVKTDMTSGRGLILPDKAAQNIINRYEDINMKNSGSFWNADGTTLPW